MSQNAAETSSPAVQAAKLRGILESAVTAIITIDHRGLIETVNPATERLLERAVTRLLDGRTGVVIAHRLATVERADRILILEEGRAAELGRRADLMRDPASRLSRLLRAGMAEALA